MEDVILVINAGSSSLKFCVYNAAADGWRLSTRGQIEGIGTAPRFSARDDVGVRLTNEAGVQDMDGEGYYIRNGIIVVPKDGVIPAGTRV